MKKKPPSRNNEPPAPPLTDREIEEELERSIIVRETRNLLREEVRDDTAGDVLLLAENAITGAILLLELAREKTPHNEQEIGKNIEETLLVARLAGAWTERTSDIKNGDQSNLWRVSHYTEKRARSHLLAAIERYLSETFPFPSDTNAPKTVTEEALFLVREAHSRMEALKRESQDGEGAASLAATILEWCAKWADYFRVFSVLTPPIVAELLRRNTSAAEASQRIESRMGDVILAMDQAPGGSESEEAIRLGLRQVVQAMGVPPRTSRNWFRLPSEGA